MKSFIILILPILLLWGGHFCLRYLALQGETIVPAKVTGKQQREWDCPEDPTGDFNDDRCRKTYWVIEVRYLDESFRLYSDKLGVYLPMRVGANVKVIINHENVRESRLLGISAYWLRMSAVVLLGSISFAYFIVAYIAYKMKQMPTEQQP